MKYTLLKGHLPSNNYDGYAAHHHLQIIALPPSIYLEDIHKYYNRVWPQAKYAELLINPWLHPWVRRNARCVGGYDWLATVDVEHQGLYALGTKGELHDGLDVYPFTEAPGVFVAEVSAPAGNSTGKATALVYEINSDDLLLPNECWVEVYEGDTAGQWLKGKLVDGRAYFDLLYREYLNTLELKAGWNATRRSAYFE